MLAERGRCHGSRLVHDRGGPAGGYGEDDGVELATRAVSTNHRYSILMGNDASDRLVKMKSRLGMERRHQCVRQRPHPVPQRRDATAQIVLGGRNPEELRSVPALQLPECTWRKEERPAFYLRDDLPGDPQR